MPSWQSVRQCRLRANDSWVARTVDHEGTYSRPWTLCDGHVLEAEAIELDGELVERP